MSSMRSASEAPRDRADSQAMRYVRALPTCCAPVGDGASRPRPGECSEAAGGGAIAVSRLRLPRFPRLPEQVVPAVPVRHPRQDKEEVGEAIQVDEDVWVD